MNLLSGLNQDFTGYTVIKTTPL